MTQKKIIIIGGGFSSLAASCYLAKEGYDVTLLEKNTAVGGRASQLIKEGFTFDMGPTFYWMPDVFETFFEHFGKKSSDYYALIKLDPAYRVYFGEKDYVDIAGEFDQIKATFESIEKGAGAALQKFIDKAGYNYSLAIKDLVYKPGKNVMEIVTPQTVLKLNEFVDTIKKQVARYVTHPKLRTILEFPVLFLGAESRNTPAFYNFMNYADFKLGTWHPKKGMYEVIKGMEALAKEVGVRIVTNSEVKEFSFEGRKINRVYTATDTYECDVVLSGADYHHTEKLLPIEHRQYSEKYWAKKTFAPSALLYYVGFDKKLKGICHHTLFFDTDFNLHAKEIYQTKVWPREPLFYASFPSQTDTNAAPEGMENAIFLIPIAPGLEDQAEIRTYYFDLIMQRMEQLTGEGVKDSIVFQQSFCIDDFVSEYNSYKGNAYGLANTLLQTHVLRPNMQSKKVKNLYFTGQLTVPGPGVPPSLISGKVVSDLIKEKH